MSACNALIGLVGGLKYSLFSYYTSIVQSIDASQNHSLVPALRESYYLTHEVLMMQEMPL